MFSMSQLLEQAYIDLQPAVAEALRQASMFTGQQTTTSEPSEGMYSIYIEQHT